VFDGVNNDMKIAHEEIRPGVSTLTFDDLDGVPAAGNDTKHGSAGVWTESRRRTAPPGPSRRAPCG
jgi:acyl-CoA reductase-like NAD-dependent aldehyde dehydrogenase